MQIRALIEIVSTTVGLFTSTEARSTDNAVTSDAQSAAAALDTTADGPNNPTTTTAASTQSQRREA